MSQTTQTAQTAVVASSMGIGICPLWATIDGVDQTADFKNQDNVLKNGTKVTVTFRGMKSVKKLSDKETKDMAVVLIQGHSGFYPADGLRFH